MHYWGMVLRKVKSGFKILLHPHLLLVTLLYKNAHLVSDKKYLSWMFYLKCGFKLNWEHPVTFCEKLQWLKMHTEQRYTNLVDKYEVKHIVANLIGADHIIPTLGVWDSFDEIDFDRLPNQFVLKCTHDSGGLVIVKDKNAFDREAAKSKINKSLLRDYFILGRETPYKNVKRRIIAEKYMVDESGTELKDYKIFCFAGVPKFIQVDFGRFTKHCRNIYDVNWNKLDLKLLYPTDDNVHIQRPIHLDEMLNLAASLSKDIPFVRIDLYSIYDKIYFGEFTFFPEAGYEQFEPQEWNRKFGDWIMLPVN